MVITIMRHTEPEYSAKELNRVLIHYGKTNNPRCSCALLIKGRNAKDRFDTAAILEYRKKNPLGTEVFVM